MDPEEDYPKKTWVKAVALLLVVSLASYFTVDYGLGSSWLGTVLALAGFWIFCGVISGFLSRDGYLPGFLLGCLLGPLGILLTLIRNRSSGGS